MPHLKNKAKIQTQSSEENITTLLSFAHQRKNKQTNKQIESAQISPYMKLTQATGPTLGGHKPKGRKNSTFQPEKRRPQTHYIKNNNNNNEKAEKYYTNEGTN